nr:retrotransposon protein, putative, unclassified [Tanacetum cinerariifolium]
MFAPVDNAPKIVCEPKVWIDAPIIEEYESDNDDDSVSNVQENIEKPSFAFTDSVKHVKSPRENVKETGTPNHYPAIEKQDRHSYTRKGLGYAFTRKSCFFVDDPHKALIDKGIVDSGCSMHMIRNKSHLADHQECKGGYVDFGGSNGKIISKGKVKAGRIIFHIMLHGGYFEYWKAGLVAVELFNLHNWYQEPELVRSRIYKDSRCNRSVTFLLLGLIYRLIALVGISTAGDLQQTGLNNFQQPLRNDGKKVDKDPRTEIKSKDQEKEDNVSSTNNVNTVGTNDVNAVDGNTSIELLDDPNISTLEDNSIFDYSNDEDVGAEADMNNLDTTIQEELLQFKLQEVWTLVELLNRKRVIGTKWVFRNKKDERGIVIKNKEDWLLKDFVVDQMDVKSAFLYVKIEEEVYVCKPLGFEDSDFPDRVYKVEKAIYGLHQAPKAYVRTTSTLMDTKKALLKDSDGDNVDVHLYSDYARESLYRKSTIGGCQFLGYRLISWQCKQTVVATSSTEAEYMVAASCCGQ